MGIADSQKHAQKQPARLNYEYYMGTALSLYLTWVGCGSLGASLAPMLGNVERFGFGMAFPAVFLVLLRGMWRGWSAARPWLVSLLVAACIYLMMVPNTGWHVVIGSLAGLVYAYFAPAKGAAHD